MTARMHAVDPWKHQNSIMEACNASCSRSDQEHAGKQQIMQIIATVLWKHRLVATIQQQQIIVTVLWKHRLVVAIQQQQQVITTVLCIWKRRLVAAIQQLYKLLYKSCIEAKQNNVAGRDCIDSFVAKL